MTTTEKFHKMIRLLDMACAAAQVGDAEEVRRLRAEWARLTMVTA